MIVPPQRRMEVLLRAPEECAACRIVGERLYCSKPGTGSIAAISQGRAQIAGNRESPVPRSAAPGDRQTTWRGAPHYALQKNQEPTAWNVRWRSNNSAPCAEWLRFLRKAFSSASRLSGFSPSVSVLRYRGRSRSATIPKHDGLLDVRQEPVAACLIRLIASSSVKRVMTPVPLRHIRLKQSAH